MTVGSIQFDSIFSAADSLRVADVSGLAPLSFNPPSPESLGRFLSSMSDGKPEVCSIRLALDSIAQNLSSPRDVSKPVVAPDVPDSRAATIAEVPVAHVVPVAKAQVVESPDGKSLVVEKPVVEAPVASAVPATPTAPVARVVETVVVEKPVVEAPVAPAAPATPTAPVAQVAETLVAEKPVVEAPIAPAAPITIDAPDSHPATIAEAPVTPTAPVAEAPVVKSPVAPVVEAPIAKSEIASAKPVVAGKRAAVPEEVVVIDLSQESARAAAPLREAPFVAAAQQEIAASTASARTEAIIEVVNNVAEAIADQILVTPSLVRGEGQMIVRLKPEVLDGSEIRLSSESGTLAVEIVPSTPNAAKLATEAMPRLETALAEHVATFRQVSVSVRKGKGNEVV